MCMSEAVRVAKELPKKELMYVCMYAWMCMSEAVRVAKELSKKVLMYACMYVCV